MAGRYGASGLFSNPLFDVLALGQVGANIGRAEVERQKQALLPDETTLRFEEAASEQGHPVYQVPRQLSPIGKLFQGIGLYHPDPYEQARPKDYLAEQDILAAQRKEQLDALKAVIGIRKDFTPKGFEQFEATPKGGELSMFAFGTKTPPDLSAPTEREAEHATTEQYKKDREQYAREANDRANKAEARREEQWKEALKKPRFGTKEYDAAIERGARMRKRGAMEEQKALSDRDWAYWQSINKDSDVVDRQTYNSVIGSAKYKTPKEAIDDRVHNKVIHGRKAIDQAAASSAELDDVALWAPIIDKLFVDTKGMSDSVGKAAIYERGMWIWWNTQNTDVALFNDRMAAAMRYGTETQHRFPNVAAAQAILKGNIPDPWHDSKQTAMLKIQKLDADIRRATGITTEKLDRQYKIDKAAADALEDATARTPAAGEPSPTAPPYSEPPAEKEPSPEEAYPETPSEREEETPSDDDSGRATGDDVDKVLEKYRPH